MPAHRALELDQREQAARIVASRRVSGATPSEIANDLATRFRFSTRTAYRLLARPEFVEAIADAEDGLRDENRRAAEEARTARDLAKAERKLLAEERTAAPVKPKPVRRPDDPRADRDGVVRNARERVGLPAMPEEVSTEEFVRASHPHAYPVNEVWLDEPARTAAGRQPLIYSNDALLEAVFLGPRS